MLPKQVSLHYISGGSDKVYHIQLVPEAAGWIVNFQYGRRGKPLRSGTKTAAPVDYDTALKAYNSLLKAKISKGYTTAPDGKPYSLPGDTTQLTSYVPQLLNPMDYAEACEWYTCNHKNCALQIKHDGERRGVIIRAGTVTGANRRGFVTGLPLDIVRALEILAGGEDLILDTEDMGDHLVIFDVLERMGNLRVFSFEERMKTLAYLDGRIKAHALDEWLKVDLPTLPLSFGSFEGFIKIAELNHEEGVVIRDTNQPYTPGRPNSGGGAYKLKFYSTVTCEVLGRHPTKRSVAIGVLDGGIRMVGNCSIPANAGIPAMGQFIEVRYLYAYKDGSLYQPIYVRLRDDKTVADKLSTLKYKKDQE